MAGDVIGGNLGWAVIDRTVASLARRAAADSTPQVLVGIIRGGLVPTVLLAHQLGIRDVRAVEVTHTVNDAVHAAKVAKPTVRNPASLGDLSGADVLVVDDVTGTGMTVAAAVALVQQAGATRIRTATCALNLRNWTGEAAARPADLLTYIGASYRGWVIFPWEKR